MPWSPSSVRDWQACPRLWWLKRQGIEGRPRDESAMEQGTAFHAAMAHHWQQPFDSIAGLTDISDTVIKRAVLRVLDQEGEVLKEQGIVGVEVNLDGDDVEAARHGRYPGTCDLITDNGNGLTVTDYKTKNKMEAKYADGELRQTQRSWQLLQYAYFTQQKYSRPVTQIRKLLVAFTPALKVWLVTYPVTQQMLSEWHMHAEAVWALMDDYNDIDAKPWQNEQSCERYGWNWRCGYYETCWDSAPIEYEQGGEG